MIDFNSYLGQLTVNFAITGTVVIDGEVVESTEAPRSDKPTGPDDQPRAIEG